ncbi:MAG: heparan-alpha-glucosaminide N-acetyltransferase [Clostridiales bacterium]
MNIEHIRYNLLDAIRGFAILNMVIYHLFFDLVYIYGMKILWFQGGVGNLWQQGICWIFIFLAGMCWSLGHHHLKRGGVILGCGLVITLVTILFMPDFMVVFGILSFLGIAILLMIPLSKILSKIPAFPGFISFFSLFIIALEFGIGTQNAEYFPPEQVSWGISAVKSLGMAILGFPNENFFSADYFPIMPWLFLFIAGYYSWQILQKSESAMFMLHYGAPWLEWQGRHSLIIYLLHQPALLGILYLIL